MDNKHNRTLGILLLAFIMIVWGSSYAVTKAVVTAVPPVILAFLRFVIATLCLLPVYFLTTRKTKCVLTRNDYVWLGLMGLTGIAGYYIFFNFSLVYTSAATGALIQGFMPAGIALCSLLFLKEKLDKRKIAGIILAFVGVLFVGILSGDDKGQTDSLKGNLLMIASVFCWTAYTLLSRKLKHIHPVVLTFWSVGIGTLLLLPAAAIEYSGHAAPIRPGAGGWLALLYMGIISSAVCYLLYNRALKELPAAVVGNFLNMDILIGVIIAFIFLHEQLSVMQAIGGLFILAGLVLSSQKTSVRRNE